MPNCLGAADGKHVLLQAPYKSGSDYFNYKKTFSIVLMGICDANYRFLLIDIGAQGSYGDSSVSSSGLGKAINENTLNLPKGVAQLPGSLIEMPFFFVGDAAFQLGKNMMRPYPGRCLTDAKSIFNYRLSRARRTIENTFGILAARWRLFRRPIARNPQSVKSIILASVCLHNFLMTRSSEYPTAQQSYCPPMFVDHEDENGEVIEGEWCQEQNMFQNFTQNGPHRAPVVAYNQRDTLATYFHTPEGQVPWQFTYIRRGRHA